MHAGPNKVVEDSLRSELQNQILLLLTSIMFSVLIFCLGAAQAALHSAPNKIVEASLRNELHK